MIAWRKVSERLHSYAQPLKSLWEKGEIDRIFGQLKVQGQEGLEIAPSSSQVFRALEETPLDKLRCVIVGDTPYNYKIEDKLVADGLLLGASNHAEDKNPYLPDELKKWIDAIEEEFCNGLCLNCIQDGWVPYFLAKEGVLMWNTSLTTIIGQKDPHHDLWSSFQEFFFKEVIIPSGVPVITLGEETYTLLRYIVPAKLLFDLPHPREEYFYIDGVLKQVQQTIKTNTNYDVDFSIALPF